MQQVFRSSYRAPSNIAFIKYWGKHGNQLPLNPSISMTLKSCYTEMSMQLSESSNMNVDSMLFEGENKPEFIPKIQSFLEKNKDKFPASFNISLESKNSFPHSAGIASSASSMAALASCLGDKFDFDLNQTSEIARLASGSACRSLFPNYAIWGKSSYLGSNDEYAIGFSEFHENFSQMQDAVLIISAEEKSISSRAGHELMNNHPYLKGRIDQANRHFDQIINAMMTGDFDSFGKILENEALSLHALMMSCENSFTLLGANSLKAIEKVRAFRKETKLPLYFTIDAGPNIHLIYPKHEEAAVKKFIESELKNLCQDELVIYDEIGQGRYKL